MKPKHRLKKYKCLYCEWRHDNLKKVIKHEEEVHGFFRNDKNKSGELRKDFIEPEEEDKVMFDKLKIAGTDKFLDIKYVWNEKDGGYDIFTDATKYGDYVKILWNNKTNKYKLRNVKKLRREYKNSLKSRM